MSKRVLGAVAVGAALLAGCQPAAQSAPTPPSSSAPVSVAPPIFGARGAGTVVTRVIDGDTFEIGTRKIRVLGIDSCEKSTPAGPRATDEANRLLLNQPVTLTAEPGHDQDRYGRQLRYVRLRDGRDYGEVMVALPHTAVYAKRNDASTSYVARLRSLDVDGRNCGSASSSSVTPTPRATVDPVPSIDVPDPDVDRPKRRSSGRVGRDGDNDGMCNESTVPVPC